VLADADVFGSNDLVGLAILEDAVLVNAGGMGEGVGTHDGLIGCTDVHEPAYMRLVRKISADISPFRIV